LHSRKNAVSALFDAILFFMIILAATGALFYQASSGTAATTGAMATGGLGQYAADIQTSALYCTVGPVDYTAAGQERTFIGSVYSAVVAVLEARSIDSNCEISGLVDAVRNIYGLLVEKPYHHGLKASVTGAGPDLYIAEQAGASMKPGAVRWTAGAPLIVNGMEGELTLYIWR
jgi:hypothetical protein